MEENLRQEEAVEEGTIPEPFQEPNDMQMESPEESQDSEAKKFQSMYDKKSADFDKLKPLIQRWILEANSRRGVV